MTKLELDLLERLVNDDRAGWDAQPGESVSPMPLPDGPWRAAPVRRVVSRPLYRASLIGGTGMSSLQAHGISHRYGSGDTSVLALDEVSLRVAGGEFVAVLGPSGSGKTTLLSVLGGLLTPTQGEVVIGGVKLADLRPAALTELRAREVGFVFQMHNLVPYLTARENLEVVGGLLAGHPGKRRLQEHAGELLDDLGLADRQGHLPSELSVGERQRVAVARALLNDPSVLMVDEPTSSLDTHRGEEVVAMLAAQARRRDVAVVMVTHDKRMVAAATRSLYLRDGRLVDPSTVAAAER